MPVTTINPNNSGTIKIAVAGDTLDADYGCQITNMSIEPEQNTSDRPGTYCAPPTSVPGRSSWAMSFDFLQDWGADPSLSQFTYDHDGELCDFEFVPTGASSVPPCTGQVYVTATAFGGEPGESWATTGSWPIEGVPVMTPPVAAATATRSTVTTEN